MAEVFNLNAASGRNIIGDDTEPTLTLENASSGNILKLQNAGGTGNQLAAVSCPTTALFIAGAAGGIEVSTVGVPAVLKSTASAVNVLQLSKTILGSPTVALLKIVSSTSSGALMEFGVVDKGVVSTASAGATVDYGIRVKVGDTYGWIPVYHSIA